MNAPWKVGDIEVWWGKDVEGQARGFSWCSLCGSSCEYGVVLKMPSSKRGSAFFCRECVEKMAQAMVEPSN